MGKGLIINEDVWELIEDLNDKECKNLMDCLAAIHRGYEVPERMRMVKGVFNRIVLDNGRFNTDLSEIRRQAAYKRWRKDGMQNDANAECKTDANDAKMQIAQEENRKEEIRIDKSRIERAAEPQPKCPLFEHEEVVTAWREWVEMRRKTKKPITTERTRTMAINKLMELSKGDAEEAVKVLNQSTDHCWVGLFAVKDEWQRPKPQPTAYAPKDDRRIDYDAVIRDMYVNDLKGE